MNNVLARHAAFRREKCSRLALRPRSISPRAPPACTSAFEVAVLHYGDRSVRITQDMVQAANRLSEFQPPPNALNKSICAPTSSASDGLVRGCGRAFEESALLLSAMHLMHMTPTVFALDICRYSHL